MHMQMGWGCSPHKGYAGGGHDMGMPLVPAPAVGFAMMVGLMMGVMIGRKKSMMHGMMGGMGHGMMGGMGRGYGSGGDWMSRKKAMMYGHHHHGYGTPPCCCGSEGEASQGEAENEGAETE